MSSVCQIQMLNGCESYYFDENKSFIQGQPLQSDTNSSAQFFDLTDTLLLETNTAPGFPWSGDFASLSPALITEQELRVIFGTR